MMVVHLRMWKSLTNEIEEMQEYDDKLKKQ